jgi:hypothetical protein
MEETTFEFLPLHDVVDVTPIPPQKVVPPSGGIEHRAFPAVRCPSL